MLFSEFHLVDACQVPWKPRKKKSPLWNRTLFSKTVLLWFLTPLGSWHLWESNERCFPLFKFSAKLNVCACVYNSSHTHTHLILQKISYILANDLKHRDLWILDSVKGINLFWHLAISSSSYSSKSFYSFCPCLLELPFPFWSFSRQNFLHSPSWMYGPLYL